MPCHHNTKMELSWTVIINKKQNWDIQGSSSQVSSLRKTSFQDSSPLMPLVKFLFRMSLAKMSWDKNFVMPRMATTSHRAWVTVSWTLVIKLDTASDSVRPMAKARAMAVDLCEKINIMNSITVTVPRALALRNKKSKLSPRTDFPHFPHQFSEWSWFAFWNESNWEGDGSESASKLLLGRVTGWAQHLNVGWSDRQKVELTTNRLKLMVDPLVLGYILVFDPDIWKYFVNGWPVLEMFELGSWYPWSAGTSHESSQTTPGVETYKDIAKLLLKYKSTLHARH